MFGCLQSTGIFRIDLKKVKLILIMKGKDLMKDGKLSFSISVCCHCSVKSLFRFRQDRLINQVLIIPDEKIQPDQS